MDISKTFQIKCMDWYFNLEWECKIIFTKNKLGLASQIRYPSISLHDTICPSISLNYSPPKKPVFKVLCTFSLFAFRIIAQFIFTRFISQCRRLKTSQKYFSSRSKDYSITLYMFSKQWLHIDIYRGAMKYYIILLSPQNDTRGRTI